MAKFHGIVPIKDFKKMISVEELQLKKGKGRKFCSTPVGVLFVGVKTDLTKQLYVTQAAEDFKSSNGNELGGSLWLVNAQVEDAEVL